MSRKNRRKTKGQKQPIISSNPQVSKIPKISNLPPKFRDGHIAWRFNSADRGGPFAWSNLNDPVEYKKVIERLTDFETMNESQLAQQNCHFIPIDDLSPDAQKRLLDINIDDLDELYSFRIKGRPRVFGVHRGSYMRVLWYDPEHKVCISRKKRT